MLVLHSTHSIAGVADAQFAHTSVRLRHVLVVQL